MTPLLFISAVVLGALIASIVWAAATTHDDHQRRRHVDAHNRLARRVTATENELALMKAMESRRFTRTQPHPYTITTKEQQP